MLLPMPIKVSLWINDKKICLYDEKAIEGLIHEKIPQQYAENVLQYISQLYPSKNKYENADEDINSIGIRVKPLIKELMEIQKKIQIELTKTWKHLNDNIYSRANISFFDTLLKINTMFYSMPEFDTYSICQLNKSDYILNDNADLRKDETDCYKQSANV